MSNEIKKHFSPRLIDFVIIVGCKEPATPSQLIAKNLQKQQLEHQHYEQSLPPELKQQYNDYYNAQKVQALASPPQQQPPLAQLPELLRRYPLDDHSDFMLPQDVTYFCQPEGCSNINCSSQERANSNRDTTSFIFSLTEKDSARVRYGICINFFRPIEKKHETKPNAKHVSTHFFWSSFFLILGHFREYEIYYASDLETRKCVYQYKANTSLYLMVHLIYSDHYYSYVQGVFRILLNFKLEKKFIFRRLVMSDSLF